MKRTPPSTDRLPIGRSLVLLALSLVTVYAFFALGAIDTQQIGRAFARRWDVLALSLLCLLGMTAATTARHKWILETQVPVTWSRVTAANVLSSAIGQWAPGSMAVAELVRATILFSSGTERYSRRELASRLAIVSIVDRALGVGVMFCFGAGAAALAALSALRDVARERLWALAATSLLVGVALVVLPLCADTAPLRLLSQRLSSPSVRWYARLLNTASAILRQAGMASQNLRGQPRLVVRSLLASAAVNILSPLAYYLSSVALGTPVPFILVAAILPTTIIGLLLPIGVAGFGGPQLVWVAHFALFDIAPESVLAMTFVQNTVVLALQSVLGIAWALAYGDRLRHALRAARRGEFELPQGAGSRDEASS